MSALRPLPPRPSLEFERKEAKALLRRLRAGDPEYGFTSWPRLVRYFDSAERQLRSERPTMPHSRERYEGSVRGLLAEHRGRRTWTARTLACYVPRLYGMRADEILASPITEDEARLAVARQSGFPSWQVLLGRSTSRNRMATRELHRQLCGHTTKKSLERSM